MRILRRAVKGSDITEFFAPEAKLELIVVCGTITEIREYGGELYISDSEELDLAVTKDDLNKLHFLKREIEGRLAQYG